MTAELYGEDAPDVEEFLCRWLSPLIRSATERRSDDPMPFCVVTRIDGADDSDAGVDEPVVQLDIFDRARGQLLAAQAAKQTANAVHRRMNLLARRLDNVTLSDGTVASALDVTTVIKPFRMPYADEQVVRYVARYRLGLSFVAA